MAERECGQLHTTIDEAIAHALADLATRLTKPLWGTRGGQIANVGRVIGYQSEDGQLRLRLDYDPSKGVHVNEENFRQAPGQQKVVHRIRFSAGFIDKDAEASWNKILEGRMQLYWNKWTSRYDKPLEVQEAEQEVDRRRREGR